MIGQLAISLDNKESVAYNMGRNFMLFNKVDSLNDSIKKIEKITASQVMDIANELFDENKISLLVYK